MKKLHNATADRQTERKNIIIQLYMYLRLLFVVGVICRNSLINASKKHSGDKVGVR